MITYTKEFKPTYLYIKRHKITGLLYFGKTTGTEKYLLEQYNGSGNYWKAHLKIHGKEYVDTVWYCFFTEKEELTKFALQCSEQWNIVKAVDASNKKIWANEKPENGLEGGNGGRGGKRGRAQPPEEKAKQIAAQIGRTPGPHSLSTKQKISARNKGKVAWNKGLSKNDPRMASCTKTKKKIICPHCGTIGGAGIMGRWHFNNCKQRIRND